MTEGPETGKRRADRAALIIAAGMLVLAAVVAWDASRLGGAASYARIGPQTVPYVIAACLFGLGIWTGIAALRGDFPEREHQEFGPVLWIVGALIAQLVLLKTAGFSIATGVMFGLVATGLGGKPLWISVPIGIILALLVFFIFAWGLALHLPAGPIENAIGAIVKGTPA
ncbi:MAG TPA: tripartite tricarboxylate transporter TctB family protein [Devosia sp.]|nr:tripartite tricarboxylate transporter TctB family protein [Devosia sp.]